MMGADLMATGNVYVAPTQAGNRKALVLGALGLVLFLGIEALLLRSFNRNDTRPPSWDQAIHMEIALDYREALAAGRPGDAWYLAPKPGMPPFPPAYHLLLMRAYSSADPAHSALWTNWFYLVLLAVSIFGIAWRFRPDESALAAVVMFCGAPVVQDLLTTQLVDLPLIAVAAAAYWALLASEEFMRWIPALAFGVLHAAGMMHKWSFFSYMFPAYWIALTALRDKRTAAVMLCAAAASFALILPWYSAHLALLPSRLVQASTDFAVSAWTPGAWMSYFQQASDSIGPLPWILGTVGLVAPQYVRRREQGWVLLAWVLTSYVFWTIVPNRQLRFLMPGLVPIGIACCATWPKAVVWTTTGLQLLAMLNFHGGWIGPVKVDLPYYKLVFLENRPPAKEDWRTEEILRRIDADRDPSAPISNVTLVANDTYFNAPTFHWMQRRLGLDKVRMRGVNRRLCEFSEFVLLKEPRVGPEQVVSGLPEAAREIRDPRGWFGKAYEETARWTLPDNNTATLFRQRRALKKPYPGKTLVYQHYSAGKVDLTDLKAAFGPWNAGRSTYESMSVDIGKLDARGLVVRDASLELVNVGFLPVTKSEKDEDWVDIRLLKLERLRLKSLDVGAEELKAFLNARVKGLQVASVELEKTVRITGTWNGKPVSAEASIELVDMPRRLKIGILSAKLAGASVPLSMFREIKELTIPLYPNPETPFAIELPSLTISGGRLTVP
ncbi:MAG: hypothetical protein M0D55_17880 [Elusimicrobiota bacterium]|nr:MAG: hypothetical protein M0D55_17880 [Elusimicrobiota bacterium]